MQPEARGATVVRALPGDREPAIAALTVAFCSDPVIRWVLSSPEVYLRTWPLFVEAFAGAAFERGTAYAVEDCSAVALWLAPGVDSDGETMQRLMSEGSDESIAADLDGVFEQMDAFHPTFEHWYLPLIGVDPAAQGRGLGSALLHGALDELDSVGVPAYLEATTPRNRILYERQGFESIGVIQHGESPPMWPMVRHPK